MQKIAVLIPCYNEEITIKKVIGDFRQVLPEADIYVYDNNSTDNTAAIAEENGAIVRKAYQQGKGNVVRAMFREIDADIFVMVDGDDTYPAQSAQQMLAPVIEGKADMVVGDRLSNGSYKDENSRALHNLGNHLVKGLINRLFNANLKDIMSGYRVFSKRFVKNIPINSKGFDVETEISLHALDKHYIIQEVPIDYQDRPTEQGSYSKLNTFSDGMLVLKTIFWVFKDYKPLVFFTLFSVLFFILSVGLGSVVIMEFIQTDKILRMPSAVLAVGLMLVAIFSLFSGFILDTIVKNHRENYELKLTRWTENQYRDKR